MVKVKVCGISDIQIISKINPDFVGIIVNTPGSKRNVSIQKARQLIESASPDSKKVLVTTQPEIKAIHQLDSLEPDFIQLHIPLNPDDVAKIAENINSGIIALVGKDNQSYVSELAEISDFIIADTKSNQGYGGTGIENDWNFVAKLRDKIPAGKFIVSGGINPGNMERIFRTTKPDVMDASSGLEKNGKKDLSLIEEFIRKGRELK